MIFPNTIPPFFPQARWSISTSANAGDRHGAGGTASHNRGWPTSAQPAGRRAGIEQILLRRRRAVDEIRWAKEAVSGGCCCQGAPGSGLPPLYAPEYEPIWSACEALGLPINHHTGSASPDYGEYPEAKVMFLIEATWWAHRTLWQLIFAGVMERHPELTFVFTEQGTAWIPETLMTLDNYHARMAGAGGSQEHAWGAELMARLSLKPSEYWARQCHVGSSFIRRQEVGLRKQSASTESCGAVTSPTGGCWPYSHGICASRSRTSSPTRYVPWSAVLRPRLRLRSQCARADRGAGRSLVRRRRATIGERRHPRRGARGAGIRARRRGQMTKSTQASTNL